MKKHKLKGLRGEMHSNAKLDWTKVEYIRKNPDRLTQAELADRLGVSTTTIAQVVLHETWMKG